MWMLCGMSKTFGDHTEREQSWHRGKTPRIPKDEDVLILLCLCLKEHSRTKLALTRRHVQVLPDYSVAFSLECEILFMNEWYNSNIPSLDGLVMSEGYFSLPHPLACDCQKSWGCRTPILLHKAEICLQPPYWNKWLNTCEFWLLLLSSFLPGKNDRLQCWHWTELHIQLKVTLHQLKGKVNYECPKTRCKFLKINSKWKYSLISRYGSRFFPRFC